MVHTASGMRGACSPLSQHLPGNAETNEKAQMRRRPLRIGSKAAQIPRWLVLGLTLAGAGCVTRPSEIDGHKVIGSKWVDGRVVYVLAVKEDDQKRMREMAMEAEEAAKGVVFRPPQSDR